MGRRRQPKLCESTNFTGLYSWVSESLNIHCFSSHVRMSLYRKKCNPIELLPIYDLEIRYIFSSKSLKNCWLLQVNILLDHFRKKALPWTTLGKNLKIMLLPLHKHKHEAIFNICNRGETWYTRKHIAVFQCFC